MKHVMTMKHEENQRRLMSGEPVDLLLQLLTANSTAKKTLETGCPSRQQKFLIC
jgi:hypothetical protein